MTYFGARRRVWSLAVAAMLAGGCNESRFVASHEQEIQQVQLLDALGEADELVVWSRSTVLDSGRDATTEEYLTPDLRLVARLEEITRESFVDPDVDVIQEAFSDGEENGRSTHGARVLLRRRPLGEPQEPPAPPEVVPSPPTKEQIAAVEFQAAIDAHEDLSDLLVVFSAEPSVAIPRWPTSPLPLSPVQRMELQLARLEAMADRGDEIQALQAQFLTWLEIEGGEVLSRLWLRNEAHVRVSPHLIPEIAARSDVSLVSRIDDIAPEQPANRDIVRESIGAQDYIDAGFDGDRGSSRNSNGILVNILELDDTIAAGATNGFLQINGGASRVVNRWDCDVGPCNNWTDPCGASSHGMRVANIAVGDFLDGQDQGLAAGEWGPRSGIAQEAHMTLTTYAQAGFVSAVQRAMEDGVDIVNHSAGDSSYTCNPVNPDIVPVNDAYEDGILWINSVGNSGRYCEGDFTCSANDHAAAYGSVAVAGYYADDDPAGSLHQNVMCKGSYGHASWGEVTDLAAPAGAYKPMNCANSFGPDTLSCAGSSLAAPHVTGAAALMMDHWIATFSDAEAHQPGRMHSALLMMGDSCGDDGDDGVHGCWGAGRLSMRRFDSAGLDSPSRFRSTGLAFTPAYTTALFPLNVNALTGVNQAMSSDVDAFVAVAWCKHPNPAFAGWLHLSVLDEDTGTYPVTASDRGEKTRVKFDPGTHRYSLVLMSTGATFLAGSIPCYVTWLWEDSDRDDADGPDDSVAPFDINGLGASCDDCC